jgi:uncharacterized protein (TIGR02145 family)
MKMTKKVILLLFILFLGTISMNAQVTIGADDAPHPGAILDLRSSKGLKLPTVDLFNVNEFQLSDEGDVSRAVGMMVYNTYDQTVDGQGSGVYIWNGEKWLFAIVSSKISDTGPAGTVSGVNGTYKTWCFKDTLDNICWMTENSMEGTCSSMSYNSGQYLGRGYYYTWEQATASSNTAACPSGWILPTQTQWDDLVSYLNGSPDATFKTAWYTSALAGFYYISGSKWNYWGSMGYYWSSTSSGQHYYTNGSIMVGPALDARYISVRCIKSN